VRPHLLAVLLLGVLCTACGPSTSRLEQIRARGLLRVATLNQPTAYYLGAHGAQGYEYRLAKAFAQRLDVQLVVQPVADVAELREALASGAADVAAAQLTADDTWRRVALISNNYRRVPQLVIQRRGTRLAKSIDELRGKRLVVSAGSPQLQLLSDLRGSGAPYLSWTELRREQADPVEWVASDDADCAIVDDSEFRFTQFTSPDTVIAFQLQEKRAVQWMLPRSAPELRDAVNAFLRDAEHSGLLERLEVETRAEVHAFELIEARHFQADVAAKLPALQAQFADAAQKYGFDWRLVAAVGYQESKWEPAAQSEDGAAGIMMLTRTTAATVGTTDRADAAQSIQGGAAYLARVRDMIPARIQEPDRTWFALAAYNVGFGHLEDARILAQSQGRDADAWSDVKQVLPLLAEERWYRLAKRGYARGWEPAKFVDQVQGYLSVLQWQQPGTAAVPAAAPATAPRTPPRPPG
jgi:membrane-bound lytic murein transglycosylase F